MTLDWLSIEHFLFGLFIVLSTILTGAPLLWTDATRLLAVFEDWRLRSKQAKAMRTDEILRSLLDQRDRIQNAIHTLKGTRARRRRTVVSKQTNPKGHRVGADPRRNISLPSKHRSARRK